MVSTKRLCATVTSTIVQGRNINPSGARRTIHSSRRFLFGRWKRYGEGSNRAGDPKFSWKQVFLQWALGVYVSTPLIAILQGSLLLNDYRVNHSDAPRPLMPARGVAVAVEEDESKSTRKRALSSWIVYPFSSSSNNHPTGHERPLRMLVVGDSLAAGVGMSKSGVPILPESIARALSKALGGRAVYWTCVGTPGVSAAQIVKDIEEIEPHDPLPKGRQLERIVKEFQLRRRRWQERREHGESQDRDLKIDHEKNQRKEPVNALVQWWKQMRQLETLNSDEILNTTRRVVYEWWMQSSIHDTYRQRKQLVEEDLSVIKEIVLQPLARLDHDDDDYYYDYYRENLPADDEIKNDKYVIHEDKNGYKKDNRHEKEQRLPLIHKGSLFRRPSIIPEAAAEYDIAIVLTGLNDVKEAFMPHMNSSDAPTAKRLESSLRQVLEALQDKMGGNMDLEEKRDRKILDHQSIETSVPVDNSGKLSKSESSKHPKNIRHPLVVVPELPVAPLQVFRLVPLCWFLIPIFRAMENNKRFLASCFPDNVIFVHQPDVRWWTDDEMGIGSIRENIQQERLLLRVTDSVRSGRERIEQLMKNYYDSKEEEIALQNDNSSQDQFSQDPSRSEKNSLVSVDRIHPNDEGYELWGRHIAAAIVEHWNKDADSCR
jgi:hypothetical protein